MDRGAWWATVHGSQRVGHDLVTNTHTHTQTHTHPPIVYFSLTYKTHLETKMPSEDYWTLSPHTLIAPWFLFLGFPWWLRG